MPFISQKTSCESDDEKFTSDKSLPIFWVLKYEFFDEETSKNRRQHIECEEGCLVKRFFCVNVVSPDLKNFVSMCDAKEHMKTKEHLMNQCSVLWKMAQVFTSYLRD